MKYVILKTQLGNITLQLDDKRAPQSVTYFCGLIESGAFDRCHFYRVVRSSADGTPPTIDIVQGGVGWDRCDDLPRVPLETTRETGLRHEDGAVALARNQPDESSSEFFICLGDQPVLDCGGTDGPGRDGFAVIGRVAEGMDVVRLIHALPKGGRDIDLEEHFKTDFLDEIVDVEFSLTWSGAGVSHIGIED